MYALGGKMSRLAGSSNTCSMVEENMLHISKADVSPKLSAQNLHKQVALSFSVYNY